MVYDTDHSGRKTPHAITDNLFGGKSVDMVWAWCFEHNDPDGKLIKKYIPKSKCYVKPNTQEIPDDEFKATNLRKWHTAVWNQKSANYKKFGFFKSNYEIKELLSRASFETFLE